MNSCLNRSSCEYAVLYNIGSGNNPGEIFPNWGFCNLYSGCTCQPFPANQNIKWLKVHAP
jgi:hypothetical protein